MEGKWNGSAHRDQILSRFLYLLWLASEFLQVTLSKGQQSRSYFYIQHFFLFNFNPEKSGVLSVVCHWSWFCFVLFPCRKLCLEPSSEITKSLFSINMTNRVWKWLPTPDSGTFWKCKIWSSICKSLGSALSLHCTHIHTHAHAHTRTCTRTARVNSECCSQTAQNHTSGCYCATWTQ